MADYNFDLGGTNSDHNSDQRVHEGSTSTDNANNISEEGNALGVNDAKIMHTSPPIPLELGIGKPQ